MALFVWEEGLQCHNFDRPACPLHTKQTDMALFLVPGTNYKYNSFPLMKGLPFIGFRTLSILSAPELGIWSLQFCTAFKKLKNKDFCQLNSNNHFSLKANLLVSLKFFSHPRNHLLLLNVKQSHNAFLNLEDRLLLSCRDCRDRMA